MLSRFRFILLLCGMTLTASSALADIDYRCLTQCKRDGKTTTACMEECQYIPEKSFKDTTNQNTLADPHNPLSTPVPIDNNNIFTKKPDMPKQEIRDYVCIHTCAQSGMQYALCEKKCTKTDSTATPTSIYSPNIYNPKKQQRQNTQ